MLVDLHLHSIYSDGVLEPSELAMKLLERGTEVASLTDHDCISGTDEMREACLRLGIKTIDGIEVSSFENAEIHILGYNFSRSSDSPIMKCLGRVQRAREHRIRKILDKLKDLGKPVKEELIFSLKAVSKSRFHIAKAMVLEGYAKTAREALTDYLNPDKPAWVDFFEMSPAEVVEAITLSGGIAVLAHPGRIKLDTISLEGLLEKLVSKGLRGIESYYSKHTKYQTEMFKDLAKRYNLINTNGSDFHMSFNGYSLEQSRAEEKTIEVLGL